MTVAVGNALQRADFRSKQSYQMYTNRFRNQENGDCLLQWSASIAEEDGSNRTVVVTSIRILVPLVVLFRFALVSHADGYRGLSVF